MCSISPAGKNQVLGRQQTRVQIDSAKQEIVDSVAESRLDLQTSLLYIGKSIPCHHGLEGKETPTDAVAHFFAILVSTTASEFVGFAKYSAETTLQRCQGIGQGIARRAYYRQYETRRRWFG